MPSRSATLLFCTLLVTTACPPPLPVEEELPPSPDPTFHRIFPTTGSRVPKNVRLWYRPDYYEPPGRASREWYDPPFVSVDGDPFPHEELQHRIEEFYRWTYFPVLELLPPERGDFTPGAKVAVRAGYQFLAEYTVGDEVDDVPPGPPQVTLLERGTFLGRKTARFSLAHEPQTLVVAMRHPHPDPSRSNILEATAADELMLSSQLAWTGTQVIDFFAVDVAGNWSTAVRVELADFGEEHLSESTPALDVRAWGPLRAHVEDGASLIVEGIRENVYTRSRHEALTALTASTTGPCSVTTVARPDGWYQLLVTAPSPARCAVGLHGEADGEAVDRTVEVELVAAERLAPTGRRSPCPDRWAHGHWRLPNGTDVCLAADGDGMIWQLPSGQIRNVAGRAVTLLDPTHLLVCTQQRCSAVDELSNEVSSAPRPPGFPRQGDFPSFAPFYAPLHVLNRGVTPADALPRVLAGSPLGLGATIDVMRWDGATLTAGTQPKQFVPPDDEPAWGWGTDWVVTFGEADVPPYLRPTPVAAYSTASGDKLWEATLDAPRYESSSTAELQLAEPWLRFHDQLYSAPGVALPDRLPQGIRIRSALGCFIAADTYPDQVDTWWSPGPSRGLWWFDACATPMRQALVNVTDVYDELVADPDGIWVRSPTGRWTFFSLAP